MGLRYEKRLKTALEKLQAENERLKAFIREKFPPHKHDHDYFHDDCGLCRIEKDNYKEIEQLLGE